MAETALTTTSSLQAEIASIERDPYIAQWTGLLTPQDETLISKGGGRGAHLYDEIRRDPHAFSVLQKRALEVTSREWSVIAASERRIDRKTAEFVERQLKAIDFDRLSKGLLGAVLKGFAGAEVIWELRGGEWWVAAVKVKKQRRFRFMVDGSPRLLTRDSSYEGEALPDRKFIFHRHSIDHDDDDPYGLGIGTVLYWPAWFKRQVLAHWLQSTERNAAPTVLATYQGSYDEPRQKQIMAAIRSMARDAGIVVPEGVVVSLLEAKNSGSALQEDLSRYLDELMSEAVLGETLSTNSGERGARSLGEIHNEVRIAIAKADADLLSTTLNKTLVRWIVDLNALPIGDGYPTVWRDFAEAEDLDARIKRDEAIVGMGWEPKEENYFDEVYGGEWVRKAQPEPPASMAPADAIERTAALFADPAPAEEGPTDAIVDQLDQVAAPIVDAMVGQMRRLVAECSSFEELGERLLSFSGSIDPAELGRLMEDAMIVANLTGRAEVVDGR